MWKKLIAPTIAVVLLWLAFGAGTAYYVYWLEKSSAWILSEYGITIEAADSLTSELWKLQSTICSQPMPYSNRVRDRVRVLQESCKHHLTVAVDTSYTPIEQDISRVMKKDYLDYVARLQRRLDAKAEPKPTSDISDASLFEKADAIVGSAAKLRQVNVGYTDVAKVRQNRISVATTLGLFGFLFVGPTIGVFWGFRMARRLHSSMSHVSITLQDAASKLDHEVGRIAVSSFTDVTDLREQVQLVSDRIRGVMKELEQERQAATLAARLGAAGELAAGVAHEIRNPLTSIKLLLHAALERSPTRSLSERQAVAIQEEIARMEKIVQGLLDFARPSQTKLVRQDLCDTLFLAITLIEGVAAKNNVSIEREFPIESLEVNADPEQLRQVFVNLMLNAIEAMPGGGSLRVSVEENVPSEGHCRIRFEDTGPGIRADIMDRIFQPFVTGKERGTGLGLAICHRLIAEHGGELTAANRPEGGACLTVELPINPWKSAYFSATIARRPLP